MLLRVAHPRFLPITEPVQVDESSSELQVELPLGSTLTVRAVDPTGRPIPRVQIRAHWVGGWAPAPSAPAHSFLYYRDGTTDEDGECVLHGMTRGTYEVRAQHPAFNLAEFLSDQRELLVLELEPRTDLPVRIRLNADVAPILGVEDWYVTVSKSFGPGWGAGMPRQLKTDSSGAALLRQVSSGGYRAFIASPRRAWQEHRRVELTGEPWDYIGPEVALKLEPEPGLSGGLELRGDAYTSEFAKVNGIWTAAARPGRATLRGDGGARSLSIQGSGGVQWVRLSTLDPEAPAEGGGDGE